MFEDLDVLVGEIRSREAVSMEALLDLVQRGAVRCAAPGLGDAEARAVAERTYRLAKSAMASIDTSDDLMVDAAAAAAVRRDLAETPAVIGTMGEAMALLKSRLLKAAAEPVDAPAAPAAPAVQKTSSAPAEQAAPRRPFIDSREWRDLNAVPDGAEDWGADPDWRAGS